MGAQGKAEHVIFSGAHPGGKEGTRGGVSEANAMAKYAEQLLGHKLDPLR